MKSQKLIIALLSIFFSGMTICHADDVPSIVPTGGNQSLTGTAKFSYFFTGDTLKKTVTKIAGSNGWQIEFASDLTSKILTQSVSGKYTVTNVSKLLDGLATQYGFNWFIYSGVLYITSQKQVTKSMEVSSEDLFNLKSNLEQLGVLNKKFGFTVLSSENKVIVSGPADYVNLLLNQIRDMNISPVNQQFAVFRLKYASATDIQLNFNNQQITIPGVATILQGMLQNNQFNKSNNKISDQVTEPVKNQLTQAQNKLNSSNSNGNSDTDTNRAAVSNPVIQADNRLNTIIIRDKASNLQIYKQLIELLDVPSPLIQVEVLIIHLDQQKIGQDGISWWASDLGEGAGYGMSNLASGAASGLTNNLAFYYGQVNPGQLLVNNIGSFVTSLQFLEKNDVAQTVGKPSVATTDNIPAIINVTENIYINAGGPGSGANTNSAYNYNYTGAQITQSLQITPHVIYDGNTKKIKLTIALEDGGINQDNNTAIPNTVQSSINSQAVIDDGQSLLLAGYTRNEEVKEETKIPGLGDIPLLGWFFKSSSMVNHKVTTLYLVTPKVIWLDKNSKLGGYVMIDGNKVNTSDDYRLYPESGARNSSPIRQ